MKLVRAAALCSFLLSCAPAGALADSTTAATISAGSGAACALTTTGGVQCWGVNGNGLVGDGATDDTSAPVPVYGLSSGVKMVVAGSGQNCALTLAGGVLCWGLNNYNQLGGPGLFQTKPVLTYGLNSGLKAITSGLYHVCALSDSGAAICWGYCATGQLGNGSFCDDTGGSSPPVPVAGLNSGVKAISAGYLFTCAVTSADAAMCWGRNEHGELGTGDVFPTSISNPVAVVGLDAGVQAISVGGLHTCALTGSGGVVCWGYNGFGQLGDGARIDFSSYSAVPVAVTGLSSGVQAVSAGADHTCALTSGGQVWCWGYNASGQVGNITPLSFAPTPLEVTGFDGKVTAISAGSLSTCALTELGTVFCWGYGAVVGDGSLTDKYSPSVVTLATFSSVGLSNFEIERESVTSLGTTQAASQVYLGDRLALSLSVLNENNEPADCSVAIVRSLDSAPVASEIFSALPGNTPIVFPLNASDLWQEPIDFIKYIELKAHLDCGDQSSELKQSVSIRKRPILLVHGWKSSPDTWNDTLPTYSQAGFSYFLADLSTSSWIPFELPFSRQYKSIEENSDTLAAQIQSIRQQTGAWQIDIVAHSMGGLISRRAIRKVQSGYASTPVVHRVVEMGVPHYGSLCAQVLPTLFDSLELHPLIAIPQTPPAADLLGTDFAVVAGYALDVYCADPTQDVPNDGVVSTVSAFGDVAKGSTYLGLFHTQMTGDTEVAASGVIPALNEPDNSSLLSARPISARSNMAIDIAPTFLSVVHACIAANEQASIPFALSGGVNAIVNVSGDPASVSGEISGPDSFDLVLNQSPIGLDGFISAAGAGAYSLIVNNSAQEERCVDGSVTTKDFAPLITVEFGFRSRHRTITVNTKNTSYLSPPTVMIYTTLGTPGEVAIYDAGNFPDANAGDGVFTGVVPDSLLTASDQCSAVVQEVTAGSTAYATTAAQCDGLDDLIFDAGFE